LTGNELSGQSLPGKTDEPITPNQICKVACFSFSFLMLKQYLNILNKLKTKVLILKVLVLQVLCWNTFFIRQTLVKISFWLQNQHLLNSIHFYHLPEYRMWAELHLYRLCWHTSSPRFHQDEHSGAHIQYSTGW